MGKRVSASGAFALALATLSLLVSPQAASAASIPCTTTDLIGAIAAANSGGGTVTLAAGCIYTLSAINNSTDGPNGLPDILGSVTVVGNGATITRSRAGGTPDFRFFLIDDGGSLNISNVTLSNGSIASGDLHGGGAILNRSTLTASGVIFANNTSLASTGGGAIDNHDKGQLTVGGSTFSGNFALQGGGIEDEATLCHTSTPSCGMAIVTNSTFINNSTSMFGGGGFEAQLDNSGTGIPPVCTGSFPWPVMPCQEAGGAHDTLIGDTFSGNSSITEGGGIASFGTMTLTNSTVYNNSTGSGGGGGIQNTGAITITQSTIAANTAAFGSNIHTFTDTTHQPGTAALSMTIVTGGAGGGANCSGTNAVTDNGYNLDSGTSCRFATNALNSTDPKLGPLASNGGPTQTMALQSGSPAIDAIPSGTSGCTGSTDQRGVSRPQGAGCDIGAFETAAATTLDDIPPSTPGGLAASATSPTAVAVSWSAATDNVGVSGYDVYRDRSLLVTVPATALGYTDSVSAGSTHTYTVDAFDAAGNHSATPPPVTVTTSTADTTPPTVPTNLVASLGGPSKVSLSWNTSTDNVAVTGYTIYRNGSQLAVVGASTLTYSDTSVVTATTYSYTVDAFDAAGNHSAQSTAASVHVPGVPKFVQAQAATTGSRVTSFTLKFGPVAKGDLLVGWFGQYDVTGMVAVSDTVNGAWTRSVSTTWHGSTAPGDIALYYFANSAAAPNGLTITITSPTATYLQGSAAEYSGVATVNPLDQAVVGKGSSTSSDSGLTASVQAGELVFGAMAESNGPGALTPGTTQGVPFVLRAQSSSGSQGEEDVLSSAAGQQHASFSFGTSEQWFVVCAVFKGA